MNITQLKQGSLNGLRKQTNECLDAAYNKGLEDGKKFSDKDFKEIQDNACYVAYNTAINDYNKMIQYMHDCTDDFKKFMNTKLGYDVMYLTKPQTNEGVMLNDLIYANNMRKVITEFMKWQEEKKNAEKEIKVGDIVKFNEKCHNYDHVKSREYLVLHIFDNGVVTILYDNGDTGAAEISLLDKTGRHIDEVSQLLNKLRGEDNE